MIKVAIVGVGNCANSLVQGLSYYADAPQAAGLMMPVIADYKPDDIEVVAAFDVTDAKVGYPLHTALKAFPNDTLEFALIPHYDVLVSRGPTLDGLGQYLSSAVVESWEPVVDVVKVLRNSGAEILINYLPVGSEQAARTYANAALAAGCAFINCMPAFIASNKEWEARFAAAELPIIGDDIKSQVGATIVHRVLATLMRDRGVRLLRTSQLNIGGNSDFYNMLERERLKSKKISKTNAVVSVAGVQLDAGDVHIGPSDHVPWLTDRKWAHIRLEGEGFGGAPVNIELKLEVWDSPNSAGVVIDAIRCARVALDLKMAGAIHPACSYYMKSPPRQVDDDRAHSNLTTWLNGINRGEELE